MSSPIGPEFIEKTKHRNLGPSDQQMGASPPPLQTKFDQAGKIISLPAGTIDSDFKKIIDTRTSVRSYRKIPLTQDELSFLLWCTQGVKQIEAPFHTFRTVPSAGARHALETYLLINNVESLSPGLYRFLALEHQLKEFIINDEIAQHITRACLGQSFIKNSAATFIWTAVPHRMTWRYQQRGYRYLFIDVGHVCQNLYLSAESIDCGVCAVAAYDDDALNDLLQLDGKSQFTIYLASVGKK